MAVASVTMFCACFSNGMSIMLPWKVNAPWKRENLNFLRGPLEIIVSLSFSLKPHPRNISSCRNPEQVLGDKITGTGQMCLKKCGGCWVLQRGGKRKRKEEPRAQPACFSLSSWQMLRAKSSEVVHASCRLCVCGGSWQAPPGWQLCFPEPASPSSTGAVLQGWRKTVCGQRAKP